MTHMLHRTGDADSLREDYPMLAIRAKGFNDEGNDWRLRKILEIAARHPIVNFSDDKTGSMFTASLEEVLHSEQRDLPMVQMVFTSTEDMTRFMEDLKEADLGISVVASGLFEEIFQCCRKAGLKPHSVHYSLGVHGRVEKLPSKETMEITTMCGHALVSKNLVTKLVADIRAGKETGSTAAETLAKDCICGILNPVRAAKILEVMSRL
ncbi:MAG TPA: hypothetical protein VLM91_03055 [Candidatus Methylomirabilis sp.]|nr:hypothetical protein [Candidatus Methylomirabilis sp.]